MKESDFQLLVASVRPAGRIKRGAARQISFLASPAGRFQVALDLDGGYRSEILPDLTLDLAGLWRDLEARLPSA